IRDFHVTGVQTCALPICCRFVSVGTGSWGNDERPPQRHGLQEGRHNRRHLVRRAVHLAQPGGHRGVVLRLHRQRRNLRPGRLRQDPRVLPGSRRVILRRGTPPGGPLDEPGGPLVGSSKPLLGRVSPEVADRGPTPPARPSRWKRLGARLDMWRRMYLPMPHEVVDRYLGEGEQKIHTNHPSFRAFLMTNGVLVLVLLFATALFLTVFSNGSM